MTLEEKLKEIAIKYMEGLISAEEAVEAMIDAMNQEGLFSA